jgi:hypothetical protein
MRPNWRVSLRLVCALALAATLESCFASTTPQATPNFTLTTNVSSVSITAGGAEKSVTVSAGAQNGFTGTIEVKISKLPYGVAASPDIFTLKPGKPQTVTFTADSAAVGNTTVEVSGTSGALTHAAALAFVVKIDVIMHHYDMGRTGLDANESILTHANVNYKQFGLLHILSVDGVVDAEPLMLTNFEIGGKVRDVLYVVTEHDSVYAFDAATYAQLWKTSVLGANETPSGDFGCGQISPEIGITATPVIDRSFGAHGAIFVVGMTEDNAGNYHQRLHALDIVTGAELEHSPSEVAATYPGTGSNSTNGEVIFDPSLYAERAGLLLLNGELYLGWTSHCDAGAYTGWLMAYSESTLKQTSVLNLTPNGSEGSIWMAGSGLAADSDGYIYFLDANGTFDPTLNSKGFPVNNDFGNGFIKVSTSGGKLAVADYFEMYDTVNESNNDEDLGSGGALVLPDMKDASGAVHHLAVGAGKDSNIYVVNRDAMGKFNPNSDSGIYQEVDGAIGGAWSMPAYYNGKIYYAASGDEMKAFNIVDAKLSTSPNYQSNNSFGYPGATPSISAAVNENGVVWAVDTSSEAILHAYEAFDLNEIYNTTQAPNNRDQFGYAHFSTPMVANGRVYVGVQGGVAVFGLLP